MQKTIFLKRSALVLLILVTSLWFVVGCGKVGAEDVPNFSPPQNGTQSGEENGRNEEKTYYTVTFDSDVGTEVQAQRIACGKTVLKPKDPVKQGTETTMYEFAGWYCGEVAWDFQNEIESDITLKAKWKESRYTVGLPI